MANIASHQADCPHKPFKCPLSIWKKIKCSWEGQVTAIENHIKSNHTEHCRTISVTGKRTSKLSSFECIPQSWFEVIFSFGEIFFLMGLITHVNLYVCIQYVGPTDKASNYRYKITINKSDMSGNAWACHVTCSYLKDVREIFRKHDCAIFHNEFANKCMKGKKGLLYEVKIFGHVT
jgi:hypothetical protein